MFVVEQECAYPEIDGLDVDPHARHMWCEEDGDVVAYLRVVPRPAGTLRIGRVVTDPAWRGQGHAARLIEAALDGADGPVEIHAQAHLRDWYAQFGFEPCGPEFIEDGIPHVPMELKEP